MSGSPARAWPNDAPSFKSQLVTLIAKQGRDLVFATTVGGKRDLADDTHGPLWAVWTGQFRSDLFVVDRAMVKAALG